LRWLRIETRISWLAAATGAFAGTLSHVMLDSVIHADMSPFGSFMAGNGLLHAIPADRLYLLCAGAGVTAAAIIGLRAAWGWRSMDLD
jgi:membrane-bound metal-dependent hydrolase YbcI (DUF457 family)